MRFPSKFRATFRRWADKILLASAGFVLYGVDMGVFLGELERVRLGPRALSAFALVEQIRGRCEALAENRGPLLDLPPAPGDPPAPPPPGSGRKAVDHYLWQYHRSLRPEVGLLRDLWRAGWHRDDPPEVDPAGLDEVVDWANWELEYARFPAPLITATAIADLIVLRPFPQGNIRLAKRWTLWLMLRAGYRYFPLASLDQHVRRQGDRLRACRERLEAERDAAALSLWIECLLECLAAHALDAAEALTRRLAGPALPELQAQLVAVVRREGRLTSRRAQELTGVSRNTLKDNFKRLVEAGHLARHGQRRGVFYTLKTAGEAP